MGGLAALTAAVSSVALTAPHAGLPPRIRSIVLHVLGNPSYASPERRWVFYTPEQTLGLWRRGFGAHWIVWTDGTVWPRRVPAGQPPSYLPPLGGAGLAWQRRLAAEAAPVYSHLYRGNADSVGIEVSHSGRAGEPFPPAQVHSLAWLVRTLLEMSDGRLGVDDVWGHKDLDRRPAYVRARCGRPGCAAFVDAEGRAYRRRVDPPEGLFAALARARLVIPRAGREDDRELLRAERTLGKRQPAHGPYGR
jgi:hypothetical protein